MTTSTTSTRSTTVSEHMRRAAIIGAAGRVGDSAWGRRMQGRRGGLAMATHGRHILLANVAAISARRKAAKLAAGALLLALVVGGCASMAMDEQARPGLAPICYEWTWHAKALYGCRPELTTRPAASLTTAPSK
jgi:hypothetical protein